MEFVASIFRSVLSWPVVLLVVAYVFRAELRGVLGRLKSARIGDNELLFEVLQLHDQVASDELPPEVGPSEAQPEEQRPPQHDDDPAIVMERMTQEEQALSEQEMRSKNARRAAARAMRGRRATDLAMLLAENPAAAVMAAWVTLEGALREAVADNGGAGENYTLEGLTHWLTLKQVLAGSDADAIKELARINDDVRHDKAEPSLAAAGVYAQTVDRLLNKLESTSPNSS